jgi:Na+/proline symporter
LIQSIALLLRGAGAAIAGATGGEIPTQQAVVLLSIMFSMYVMAGGLIAAAYTDVLQGVMIIVLSVLLVPAGLKAIGGMSALHEQLSPEMLQITAPPGSEEGNVGFVIAMSLLGLTGVVVQPHVMSATGSGKSEMEARVGMTYGNFIKRLLTIAWGLSGLIALVMFSSVMAEHAPGSLEAKRASETLFGRAIRELLGDGWRGLMLACIIAGVTSAETFMVVGAGIFTRNFYRPLVRHRSAKHYLWTGRFASAIILAIGITAAFMADSVTHLVMASVQVIGLLGAAFWLGVVWRRANRIAVWCSFLASIAVWSLASVHAEVVSNVRILHSIALILESIGDALWIRGHSRPIEILIMLAVQFGVLIIVSLLTREQSTKDLDLFYARLLTPVGKEEETFREVVPEDATLAVGLHGKLLDYHKASFYGYAAPRRLGFEIPRMTVVDWGGFLAAWSMVGALIVLLIWLANLGK